MKKLLSVFIHFIPGVPLLLLFSLLLRRWLPRLSYALALTLCLLLLAASFPPVSRHLVASLENQFPVLTEAPDDTGMILVHGYGHLISDNLPVNSQLNPVALTRLSEGVRLWRTRPEVMLAVSGGASVPGTVSHAEYMHKMALQLGVDESQLVRFDQTRDTEHEISTAIDWLKQKKLQDSRLVVVSTAMHLPRSAMVLDRYQARYTMAPTEFTVDELTTMWPGVYSLLNFDRALHEYVGMAWYRIKWSR